MKSFSGKTKSELARVLPSEKCCWAAELAALVNMVGSVKTQANNKVVLSISTDNAAVIRKGYRLVKALLGVKAKISVRHELKLRKGNIYALHLSLPFEELELSKIMVFQDNEEDRHAFLNLVAHRCCKRAYLRGSFLGGGSVSNPEGLGSYHLEIIARKDFQIQLILQLMTSLNLNPKVGKRKRWRIIYLKESEQIVDFLNLIGAHTALLNYENIRVFKNMRNIVNRLVNCETANLNKSVNASLKQLEWIQVIRDRVGLKELPSSLREVAELRLQYPDANLKELGQMLTPKLGKSGVNHRMRLLKEMAEGLMEKGVKF